MQNLKYGAYISIILAILGLAGYFLYTKPTQKTVSYTSENLLTKVTRDNETDSDGDGLRDWEELLWETDPFNPDSDGDGTLDGAEVLDQRDPTVRGPADTIIKKTDNTTTKLAEGLISGYLNNDGKLSETEKEELIDEVLKNLANRKSVLYSESDLNITTNSGDNHRTFGIGLANTFAAFDDLKEDEMAIFAKAISSNNEGDIGELDPIIKAYKNFLSDLLLLPTPKDTVSLHLSFVNSLQSVIQDIEDMRFLFSDTAVALTALSTYQQDSIVFQNNLDALLKDVAQKNKSYSTQ